MARSMCVFTATWACDGVEWQDDGPMTTNVYHRGMYTMAKVGEATKWLWYRLSNGKLSDKTVVLAWRAPFTPLRNCGLCLKWGSQKIICPRDLYGWNSTGSAGEQLRSPIPEMLCMSCYNKVLPVVKVKRDVDQIRPIINKLTRTIRETAHPNHR